MNKILFSLAVIVCFITQGQKNTIKSGIYKDGTSFILFNMVDEICVFFEYSGDTISNKDTLNIIHVDKSIIIVRRNCDNKITSKQLRNNVESRVSECSPYSNLRIDIKKNDGKLLLWNRRVIYKRFKDWDPTTNIELKECLGSTSS
jgi:hypothetical protein